MLNGFSPAQKVALSVIVAIAMALATPSVIDQTKSLRRVPPCEGVSFLEQLRQQNRNYQNSSVPLLPGLEDVPLLSVGQIPAAAAADASQIMAPLYGEVDAARAFKRYPANTVVFISLAMPEQVLRALFVQAQGRDDVVFALRGWDPPNFLRLFRRVRTLLPAPDSADINIEINPQLFRGYGVEEVPVFLHRATRGWQRVVGEISLRGAEAEVAAGRFGRRGGPTYAIEEPDILEEIEAKVARYDWVKAINRIRERSRMVGLSPVELPTAENDSTQWIDPSVIVAQDINDPQGRLIAAKGTRINPLEHLALRPIAAFDPGDERQIAIVSKWAHQHDRLLLLANHLPAPAGGVSISQRMGRPVYPLNVRLLERLGIDRLPALAEQLGPLLRITHAKP